MSVSVRRATKGDAPDIARFAMNLVEQHRSYDPIRFALVGSLEGMAWFYASQTDVENAAVLVAEVEGRIAGFAYVTYVETDYLDLAVSAAQLQDIYVSEAARNSGAGKALIDAVVGIAKEFGASKLLLSVAAKNIGAQKFFEQAGFVTTMHEMMLVPDRDDDDQ